MQQSRRSENHFAFCKMSITLTSRPSLETASERWIGSAKDGENQSERRSTDETISFNPTNGSG